ncbi:hypothetical protein BC940DRAFT_234560 [Gongronella butleri]|nr:hypothetical protein BC940DRAFT_234560 [Gongronella butleri]
MPVYIVTGASKGIGKATVLQALNKPDGKVVAIARSNELLLDLQKEAKALGHGEDCLQIVTGDVCEELTVSTAVDAAISQWGQLDVVIANAGVLDPISTIANCTAQEWQASFNVNLFSIITLVQKSLPHLRESRGTIILVSSGAASTGYKGWGCYGASKAALNHLGMTLAVEEPDVTTVCVRPGVVDTGMQEKIRSEGGEIMQEFHKKFVELHEQGKLLTPDQPGRVLAGIGANPPRELSGKYVSWDDAILAKYRA